MPEDGLAADLDHWLGADGALLADPRAVAPGQDHCFHSGSALDGASGKNPYTSERGFQGGLRPPWPSPHLGGWVSGRASPSLALPTPGRVGFREGFALPGPPLVR